MFNLTNLELFLIVYLILNLILTLPLVRVRRTKPWLSLIGLIIFQPLILVYLLYFLIFRRAPKHF